MASIMKLIIEGDVSSQTVISWLKNDTNCDTHQKLLEHTHIHHEFIPYFLNYLRYQTLHLLQSGKLGTPSPVKTPTQNCDPKNESRNCVRLFADSPSDSKFEHLILSPDTAYNNSNNNNKYRLSEKNVFNKFTNNLKTEYSQSNNFTNSHKSPSQLHENQRIKQKLCFGEFLKTPEVVKQKRKGLSSLSQDSSPCEGSPSPTGQTRKCSSGKRKGLFHTHNAGNNGNTIKKDAPIFSLQSLSDFPPVAGADNLGSDAQCKINEPTRNLKAGTSHRFTEVRKPSRRIKPTFLMPGSKTSQSSSFTNAPYEDPRSVHVLAPMKCVEDGNSLGKLVSNGTELFRHQKTNPKCVESCDVSTSEEVIYKTPTTVPVTSHPGVTVTTPSKSKLDRGLSGTEFMVADPSEVTHTQILDTLADLYSGCLKEHLFPNVIQELYFLTQLLTTQGREITELEAEETLYFLTVHNAVYFAVSVLERQINILKLLDKSTVKCLCDNQRVTTFSPTLRDKLQCVYNTVSSVKKTSNFPQSPIGGVSFQADTDNRKNFPNDRSFHQFKKQRDLFYELIREWELKHEAPGWSMVSSMANRIRSLIEFQTDLANHLHFARLFQSQLITMCKGDNSIKMDGDDEQISLLNHLKKTNPEKFKKLQERFIQPFSTGGPCPPPRFQGYEEFFRDFIVAASSATFNQHLSNIFISKVAELNNQEFCQSTEKQESSLAVEGEQDREMFESCLLTLRLVGKFLGFLTFEPYCTSNLLPDVMQTDYLALRNKIAPPLDVTTLVKTAMVSKRLVVTVPWVVQFLSMMDYAAPLTDYYHILLSLLIHILKLSWKEIQEGRNTGGHFLIVVLVGWLLENTRMLGGLFFQELPPDVLSPPPSKLEHNISVDCHDLVSQDLVCTCCPYAGEMRSLLMEFAVGTNSRTTIRKITPVAADTGFTVTVSQKQLQSQLEENFFHNHHTSLKRTVEFVAERTASNFIKRFRSTVLPNTLSEAKKRVEQRFLRAVQSSPSNKTKDKLSHELHSLAHSLSEEVKASFADKHEFCLKKISEIMPLLLPEEQPGAVVSVATSISCRQAEERIVLWFNMHITKSMFLRELTAESDRLIKADLLNKPTVSSRELSVADVCSDGETRQTGQPTSTTGTQEIPPGQLARHSRQLSEIFADLKFMVRSRLLAPDDPIDLEKIDHLLTETFSAFTYRKDVLTQTTKCLSQVLLDLMLFVVCAEPRDLDVAVFEPSDLEVAVFEPSDLEVAVFEPSDLEVAVVEPSDLEVAVVEPSDLEVAVVEPSDLEVAVVEPSDLEVAVVERCVGLWKGPLAGVAELHHVVSYRVCHGLVNSRNPQISWQKYSKFVVQLLEQNLLTPSSFQKNCLQLLQTTELYTEELGRCLCRIVQHFNLSGSQSPDICDTLKWIFNIRKVNSDLSQQILSLISSNQNCVRTSENLLEKHKTQIPNCDASGDNNGSVKFTGLVKTDHVMKTMDDIIVGSEKVT